MKRTPLLGRNAPGVPWNDQVSTAVCRGDADEVIRLVSQFGGVRRLREGFAIGTQNGNTFSRLCLHTGAIAVLRSVVEVAPGGLTLQDCCTHHVEDPGGLSVYSNMVLHEEALGIEYPSAAAMALALEYEPAHPCLKGPLDRFEGASLHYEALKCATMGVKNTSGLARVGEWAECARLLMSVGAPIEHRSAAHRSTAAQMLFGHRWNRDDGLPTLLTPLLHDYVRGGWVDINAPVPGGRVPLELAIVTGNGYAAAAAIDLGCDLKKAVPEGYSDLIELARDFSTVDWDGSVVPLVTEALLRRKFREADVHTSPAHADASPAAPTARRAQRARI